MNKQARTALKNTQPEQAHRLLDQLTKDGHRRAWSLRPEVVRAYVERGERALGRDDIQGAWKDLQPAEILDPEDVGVLRLRKSLVQLLLTEARILLELGDPTAATNALNRLREKGVVAPEAALLEEAAQDWVLSRELADRGEFVLLKPQLEQIRRRLGGRTAGLDRFQAELTAKEEKYRTAWDQLRRSADERDWPQMMVLADEIISVAPRDREAWQARSRAWQVLQPEPLPLSSPAARTPMPSKTGIHVDGPNGYGQNGNGQAQPVAPAVQVQGANGRNENGYGGGQVQSSARFDEAGPGLMPRQFYLFIDGVGAWLVCLNSKVVLGQATGETPVDVPLFADVSRVHANLIRDEESWVMESNAAARTPGGVDRRILNAGDSIALSATCCLKFEQNVPGCLTSRLVLMGSRRLPMAVDGVILMADMLVCGSGTRVHIPMSPMKQPLYLVRQQNQLWVQWKGPFRVNGEPVTDRAPLPMSGSVTSEDFTFAIEPVAGRG